MNRITFYISGNLLSKYIYAKVGQTNEYFMEKIIT